VPGLNLRIVSIDGIDHQACGGTHVDRTGEIGMFKIVKRESVQDGVERVTFKCYLSALKYMQEKERAVRELAEGLGVPESQLNSSVMRFFEEWKERGKKLEKMEEHVALSVVKEEIEKAKKEGKDVVELENLDWTSKKADLAAKEISDAGLIAILSNREKFIVVSVPEGNKESALELLKAKGGKGGGNEKIARGKIG
jgi:alanyl-tRNA synthetase